MEKLSLKKKLLLIRLYTEGFSYNEIAIRASVGKGTVANVVSELKSGRFPEFGDLSEQLELIRELAIDPKRTRLAPIQAAVGVSVLSRLRELEVEPGEIEGLSALCRTLNADGIDIQSFIRAALLEERRHVVTDIKAINTVAKSTITKLKQDLSTGVRESVIEVNKLKNQALQLGRELGQFNEMIESNRWLKGLQALVKGDKEVDPSQVRVLGITVLEGILFWLGHRSEDSNIPYLLRSSISNLIGDLKRWKT